MLNSFLSTLRIVPFIMGLLRVKKERKKKNTVRHFWNFVIHTIVIGQSLETKAVVKITFI